MPPNFLNKSLVLARKNRERVNSDVKNIGDAKRGRGRMAWNFELKKKRKEKRNRGGTGAKKKKDEDGGKKKKEEGRREGKKKEEGLAG